MSADLALPVVATPVVHTYATPSSYPTATPGAVPLQQYHDASLPTISNVPLSFSDTIYAVADFVENASFRVDIIMTPLRLVMAWFMLGCVHLASMIRYKDYKLPGKAIKCLQYGFCSGSKVFWTLFLSATMYLSYDKLTEDPSLLAIMELLFLEDGIPGLVARFVRAKYMSWHNPFPEHAGGLWLCAELFGDVHLFQQKGQFIPKTFTELGIGILVWLYRLAAAHYNRVTTLGSAIWSWIRPRAKVAGLTVLDNLPSPKQVILFMPTLHRWFQIYLRLRYEYIILPVLHFFFLVACYIFQRNSRGGVDHGMVGNWDYNCAFMSAPTLTRDAIAKLMLATDVLEKELAIALPDARREAAVEVQADMKLLGERCRSWRTSHLEMAKDYNHARRTLDLQMTLILYLYMGLDPLAEHPRDMACFRSNQMIVTWEPGLHGLHYKPNPVFRFGDCSRDIYDLCEKEIQAIFWSLKHKKRPTAVKFPAMDIYDKASWSFNLHRLGFKFARFSPENNPIDLSTRRAIATSLQQMEDYAIDGRTDQWHAEELDRRKERARRRANPFLNTWN
ncbi:hypothetical protein CC86DRAFT_409287 [Ophiobolus disseminans]|uniref:Transmembrane protein n=1 Tax=Ophiobolus disseminans TaxID=1469910 RepID=A0A6A6ZQM5_9PLEO|nr:hypothetical protein CC86DRAFT_409287 [Ophiobolus disseminans]